MNVKLKPSILALTAGLALAGSLATATAQDAQRAYSSVTDEMVLDPPAGDWLMWRGSVNNHGYSPLDQINKENVGELELAWAWPMADVGLQQTTALEHDGIMFINTNNSIVQALDAKTGDLIWEYRHALPEIPSSWGYLNYQSRRQKNSIALYGDMVYLTTVDAKIVALDAATGKVAWDVQAHDYSKGYSYTVGPLVVNGKVISAISGCSIAGTAGGCFITAHDAETGEELWRFNTLDDPKNPEQVASWGVVPPENRWGGTPWAVGSYDPASNMTFWGVGMPAPYAQLVRGSEDGAALYTNSTLALDADTGELKWYFQHLPQDNWDLDSPFERVLVDMDVDGETHEMLVSVPGKNGIAFALDRNTGKYLWSLETVYQNVVTGIDEDGTVHINEELISSAIGESHLACTSVSGGKLWQAAAFSPRTQNFYVPLTEACNTTTPVQTEFTAGNSTGSLKFGPRVLPEGIDQAGLIEAMAINPTQGEHAWQHRQRTIPTSSVIATAGGVVFGGDAGRFINAWDDETGEVLWQQRLNAPIGGSPSTFEVDGEQYLAVPTGYSAAAGSAASLFPEVPLPSGAGNSIFVFKLPKAAN